eukprot:3539391-Lingulodinium_polyedra.AAC.1
MEPLDMGLASHGACLVHSDAQEAAIWITAEVDWEKDNDQCKYMAPEDTKLWAQQEPHSACAARGGHALDPADEPGVGSLARG